MLSFDGSRRDIGDEDKRRIKGEIKRAISTFFRIEGKEDRKNLPRLKEALKKSLVEMYADMPEKNMFGIEQLEIDYYRGKTGGEMDPKDCPDDL